MLNLAFFFFLPCAIGDKIPIFCGRAILFLNPLHLLPSTKIMENTNTDNNIIKLTEDGKVTKRIIKEGTGRQADKSSTVTIHFESYLAKSGVKYDSSRDRELPLTIDFTEDESKVIKGWEIAIPTMKIGEVAEITCSYKYGYGVEGLYPLVPPKSKIRAQVALLSAWHRMTTPRERLDEALVKKEEGSMFFKSGEIDIALLAYIAARRYVIDLWDCSPEDLKECRLLTIAIQLNISACYMKLRKWADAVDTLNYVLERDPKNVKAFYRLGQVYMEQLEYDQGILVVNEGLTVRIYKTEHKQMIYKKIDPLCLLFCSSSIANPRRSSSDKYSGHIE
ncbi:hypothetical protein BCR42DRAFT_406928 [Absidia repens]|uniref:peptidylprolyl isomerase n=1 Tax=Absidia repens TaxID=90262 RepID=A0A1X2IRI8_9FUNG|nr:hypothetical protein BCR42DRAFT_406928 [Absidia repens]